MNLREGLLVAGIVRQNGAPVIPSGADALQEGDDVVIVTTDTTCLLYTSVCELDF